jgi:hypothetical protein
MYSTRSSTAKAAAWPLLPQRMHLFGIRMLESRLPSPGGSTSTVLRQSRVPSPTAPGSISLVMAFPTRHRCVTYLARARAPLRIRPPSPSSTRSASRTRRWTGAPGPLSAAPTSRPSLPVEPGQLQHGVDVARGHHDAAPGGGHRCLRL